MSPIQSRREEVMDGSLPPSALVLMTSNELASAEVREVRKETLLKKVEEVNTGMMQFIKTRWAYIVCMQTRIFSYNIHTYVHDIHTYIHT
jgi:hypothetical protein